LIDSVPDILARIVSRKREGLANLAAARTELELSAAACALSRRDFRRALVERTPAIIAEIKKASPSKGLFAGDLDPARLAREYESGGAAAVSVLTDTDFFQGNLQDLQEARHAIGLPVLRKDFTIDELHVVEAAAHGADAILLIAAILDIGQLRSFRELAASYGMAALVEVHNEAELDRAVASGAGIIGVNNRNLHTFEVDLETSLRLAPLIPEGVVKVSESGIHSALHVQRLSESGFQAFLVGEHLVKSGQPAAAIRLLMGAA